MRDLTRQLQQHPPTISTAPADIAAARRVWSEYRERNQWGAVAPLLTPPDGNVKLAKGDAANFGLSLAPHTVAGVQVCRYATETCRAGCLNYSGKGGLPKIQAARVLKTRFLAEHPDAFVTLLAHEIRRAEHSYGARLRVRLNVFSDLPWETFLPDLFAMFPRVRFYDYTKWPDRETPANYHLTHSASERTSDADLRARLARGQNVAVVFTTRRSEDLPREYLGARVIDGDKDDDRTRDPRGVVVGLRVKGTMRQVTPGGMVRAG